MSTPLISPDNNFTIRHTVTRDNLTTGVSEPATGRNDVVGFLAASPDEAAGAIDASLSVALTERGTTGEYSGVLLGSDLTSKLTPGQTVYEVVKAGAVFRFVTKCKVAVSRAPIQA